MIKPDQIPDEVADAIRHCFHTRGVAKIELAAAINAWPGMLTTEAYSQELNRPCLILPLPTQEPGDE